MPANLLDGAHGCAGSHHPPVRIAVSRGAGALVAAVAQTPGKRRTCQPAAPGAAVHAGRTLLFRWE